MSPLCASAQPPAGHEGSAAMPAEIICGCALCEMEPRLLASLAVADERLSTFTESSLLLAYPSIADLVRDLRAAPAHAESDALLGEILKGRAARPMSISPSNASDSACAGAALRSRTRSAIDGYASSRLDSVNVDKRSSATAKLASNRGSISHSAQPQIISAGIAALPSCPAGG